MQETHILDAARAAGINYRATTLSVKKLIRQTRSFTSIKHTFGGATNERISYASVTSLAMSDATKVF